MKRIAIFFTALAISVALAWLGGYDFDHRGIDVALYTFGSICCATAAAICPLIDDL